MTAHLTSAVFEMYNHTCPSRFDIFGSTLADSVGLAPGDTMSVTARSLLHDAEGNHCSSFPAVLLELIQIGSQLSQPNHSSCPSDVQIWSRQQKALQLLSAAHTFDPYAWATALQPRSPANDLQDRMHVASAHRAAVCVYLMRVLVSINSFATLTCNLEPLVEEIIAHLSFVCPNNALFTATTWPAFIAGAEASDCDRQKWVANRLHEMWAVEPWGLIRGALGVLERLWARGRSDGVIDGEGNALMAEADNWMNELRGKGVDWLIL